MRSPILISVLLASPALGSVNFYAASGPAPSNDAAFNAATGTFNELDLNGLTSGSSVDLLPTADGTIDVGLGSGFVATTSTCLAFAGSYVPPGQYGTVSGTALLNNPGGGQASKCQMLFEFVPTATAFGAWTFDDGTGSPGAFRLHVVDVAGWTWTSPVVDHIPGAASPFFVDGFLGATSTLGLTMAVIESGNWNGIDPATFVPAVLSFEIDHLHVKVDPVPCTADLSGDGVVDGSDLGVMLAGWGQPGQGDLDNDGLVAGGDLGILLSQWGPC